MMLFAFIPPTTARNLVLIVAGLAYLGYHLVRWQLQRKKVAGGGHHQEEADATVDRADEEAVDEAAAIDETREGIGDANSVATPPSAEAQPATPAAPKPGEALYIRARAMVHQVIPDYQTDGLYLDMLGDSAAEGYGPAMVKLGDYAMRREMWVEAYYWMWRAKRAGTPNLDNTLRNIRKTWVAWGSHSESFNVSPVFSVADGDVARALLNISMGRDVDAARALIKQVRPEFL